jgi:hypothetical protein
MRADNTPHTPSSVVGAILKGAAAGLVGTLAMDLLWYRRYRRDGGDDAFLDWEFSAGTTGYDEAGAPAQVGKRVAHDLLGLELPPKSAAAMNNAVHLATGAGWGAAHAIAIASIGRPATRSGFATGIAAWASSYAMLAPLGIYKPMWEYPPGVLWKDLSAHLVFGLGTGLAYRALA